MAGVIERLKGNKTRLTAAALLMLLVVTAACSAGDSDGGGDGASAPDGIREAEGNVRGRAPGAVSVAGGGGGGGGGSDTGSTNQSYALGEAPVPATASAAKLPKFGPSVIKTATVDIGLPKAGIPDALNEAISIAGRHGGFVLSSKTGRESRGTLTMRIPSQSFETALAELEELGKVRSENISGQDVGQDFVDLEARLRNWESQEAVLLRLMDRAESVQDTIRVQGELSRVQLEIEQIRGRLRFLRDQTSYGTITASFGPVAPAPSTPGRFAKAWERAVDLMQGFVEAVIVASGVVLPLGLLALLVYLIFRSVRPKLGT